MPNKYIELENQYGAHNYLPLPVVLNKGEGAYVWDEQGRKYLDMMSAYSAVSHGHCHPRLVKALCEQAKQLTVVSRAYHTDKLGLFLKRICELTHFDKALPMNTGAEAVETALKAARKWAYTVKKVTPSNAEIIVCENNFHGRTITIVGMSTEEQYKEGFGPFPQGFKTIPFGDPKALEQAITENTAAFLLEPIQGEAGIIVPPPGYLKKCADICKKHNVLLICDEIQSGLGRTGRLLACDHENVKPDGLILGKALGGGMMPVSLFLANNDVMNVFTPGDHGSTFGGNPLACVVALEAINTLLDEKLIEQSAELGNYMMAKLKEIEHPGILDIRGKGLWIGLEINPDYTNARDICLRLMEKGILSKETHHTVVRLAPPFVITREEIDMTIENLKIVFNDIDKSQ